MRYFYWTRSRTGRLFVILLAILAYFFFLTLDDLHYLPHYIPDNGSYWLAWVRFGFSAYISLMFLAVGALVWLYARGRRVAILLFLLCLTMMITFALQTDSASNDALPLLSTLGNVASSLSTYFFSILVLLFPKNTFAPAISSNAAVENPEKKSQAGRIRAFNLVLQA